MAVYTSISKDEISSFLENYNVGKLISFHGILEGIENTNYKIITSEREYILTIFEKRVNPEDLPFFIELKKHLSGKNFLCPEPINDKNGKNINLINNKSCVLVSFLEGSKLADVTIDHCFQVGKVMALLHEKTQDFKKQRINSLDYNQWINIFAKCKKIKNDNYNYITDIIDNELIHIKNNWPTDLPKGIIHADLFQDNVFFKRNKFSGLIDFYFACNDFYCYDIALTINAWCFNKKIEFNFKRYKALIEGYEEIRKLKEIEKNSIPILLRGSAIRILITRLHDEIFYLDDAFVEPKNPKEYVKILQFHQQNNKEFYI